jgi:hypothetical protein
MLLILRQREFHLVRRGSVRRHDFAAAITTASALAGEFVL